jgi:hypothetical protein
MPMSADRNGLSGADSSGWSGRIVSVRGTPLGVQEGPLLVDSLGPNPSPVDQLAAAVLATCFPTSGHVPALALRAQDPNWIQRLLQQLPIISPPVQKVEWGRTDVFRVRLEVEPSADVLASPAITASILGAAPLPLPEFRVELNPIPDSRQRLNVVPSVMEAPPPQSGLSVAWARISATDPQLGED